MSESNKTASALARSLASGDPAAVARALTLVENGGPEAEALLTALPRSRPAARLGITGPPGAGKSTLVARLVPALAKAGHAVGVVAVDPSSQFSGGALLGDRFRFNSKEAGGKAFFRSVAHRGAGGGLALSVRAMLSVLEAAGKDWLLVESLGVGQSELEILGLVDTVVVVLVPEAGDYIQALKAGIMEAGDVLVVNKMDRDGAEMMRDELLDVLSYSRSRRFPDWQPPVLLANAREGKGVPQILDAVRRHRTFLASSGRMEALKEGQARRAVEDLLQSEVKRRLSGDPALRRAFEAAGRRVAGGKASPYAESRKLAGRILKGGRA